MPQGGGGVAPQATWTPVNCNITVASLCTPVCGAAAMPQGAQGYGAQAYGGQGGGVEAQATFTPINCNVTPVTQPPICPQITPVTHPPFCPQITPSIATPICGGPIVTRVPQLCLHTILIQQCPPVTLATCPTRVTPICVHPPITLGGCPIASAVACPTFGACPSIACTPGQGHLPQPQVGAQAAQVDPQATWTPVNCNITVASLCTPICGQAAAAMPQGGGVEAQATFTPINCNVTQPPICLGPLTHAPICPPVTRPPVCPQLTVTPVCPNTQPPVCLQLTHQPVCQIRTLTPVCGPTHVTPLCQQLTHPPICPQITHQPVCPIPSALGCPTFGACPSIACTPGQHGLPNVQGAGVDPQATWTPVNCNITVATLCTPVCGQAMAGQAAAMPQGVAPQATIGPVQCNITIFSICTPVCG